MLRNCLTAICIVTGLLSGSVARAQTNADYAAYIRQYAPLALAEEQRTGIPAAIKMAQALLESGAGKGNLALRSNNHFGIKCKSTWTGPVFYHDDDARQECFRGYDSVAASFEDHSNFLRDNVRYERLFQLDKNDYRGWAYGLKSAGYATNPRYPQLLIKVIVDNRLDSLSHYWLDPTTSLAWKASAVNDPVSKIAVVNNATPAPDQSQAQNLANPIKEADAALPYPTDDFFINHVKVMYAPEGTSLLALAQAHRLTLAQLCEYNDMATTPSLHKAQLVFLEKKRRLCNTPHHVAQSGETWWGISQLYGLRLSTLLAANKHPKTQGPVPGTRVALQDAGTKP